MNPPYRILPLGPDNTVACLIPIWSRVFGDLWPVNPSFLHSVLRVPTCLPGDHLLLEADGRPVGFALTQVSKGDQPYGSLLAIGLLPEYRRQGLGRALHAAALERLARRGARRLQLAAGALAYFWPGVPTSLPAAWPFFQSQGWTSSERSVDLVRSLDDYKTPDWVWQRITGLGIEFVSAENLPPERVTAFVAAEETGWVKDFTNYLEQGRASDVLLAQRQSDGEIIAACLLEADAQRWAARFPQPLAAPGCYLTAGQWQNRGIGMALVARSVEILQARGCKTCFIGWTWLVDWYGKLGFQVWQENIMSWKEITTPPDKKEP
jgi:GNAT superfamily N-acetyltransferase